MTPCRSSTADHSVILKIVVAGCHCEYLCASWPWWFRRFWWPWCPVPWALSGHNLRKRAWPSGLGLPSYHTLTVIILLWSQLIRLDQRQSEILILRPSQEVDERNTLFSGHSCHTGQSWSKVYIFLSRVPIELRGSEWSESHGDLEDGDPYDLAVTLTLSVNFYELLPFLYTCDAEETCLPHERLWILSPDVVVYYVSRSREPAFNWS